MLCLDFEIYLEMVKTQICQQESLNETKTQSKETLA